jgi:AcrR family transcriptional regulator
VAKRIGYSAGTLYVIFKNIDDLKFALNAGTLLEMRHRLNEAIAPIADPEERLRSMARFYLDFGLASTNLWRLMFEHRLPDDEPIPEEITQQTDALLVTMVAPFRELIPGLSEKAANNIAGAFWSALHGIAHLVITDKLSLAHVDSAYEVLDTQMSIFIAGVKHISGE